MKTLTLDEFAERVASSVLENEGSGDITTLFNMIYGHDMRKEGYDWTNFVKTGQKKKVSDVFYQAPLFVDRAGGFIKESKPDQPMETNGAAPQQMYPTSGPAVAETNPYDPRITSTDPNLINCAAFLQGHCRVSGRVCIYTNMNMDHCGIRHLITTDPQYWEIPFGREMDPAYCYGYKA